jgi:hypothetical protein
MGRLVIALALISLVTVGCAGSQSEPQGQISVVVSLSGTQAARHYTLRCGPAGGTMPDAEAACSALADYVKHRSDPGRFCSSLGAGVPRARVTGTFDGRRLRLDLTTISWCGVSEALMRDYWILSTFPCSTPVMHYSNQHPYSKGIAPERCLRGR